MRCTDIYFSSVRCLVLSSVVHISRCLFKVWIAFCWYSMTSFAFLAFWPILLSQLIAFEHPPATFLYQYTARYFAFLLTSKRVLAEVAAVGQLRNFPCLLLCTTFEKLYNEKCNTVNGRANPTSMCVVGTLRLYKRSYHPSKMAVDIFLVHFR